MNFYTLKTNELYTSQQNRRNENNLFLFKERNRSQQSLFSSLITPKEKINNLKLKYNLLKTNNISTQLVHRKVEMLKNKYMKNNQKVTNNLKINNVIRYSISNNKDNKIKLNPRNNAKKSLFRSSSLQLVKENNFKFNNLYNTFRNEKKIFFSEINNKVNDDLQFKSELNNKSCKTNIKNGYNFKYLRNVKEDFINVHNKLKELLKNDAFNKKKKMPSNAIFPISKKIYLLSEMKKDIKNVNKYSLSNMSLSPNSTNSANSETLHKNFFVELFNESDKDTLTNYEGGIIKPHLIRTNSKPKLNVPKFSNLFNMKN